MSLTKGQLVLVTNEADQAAIEISNKLAFVLGEYFLDTRQGVPYQVLVWKKNPDLLLVKQMFRQVFLSVQTVSEVLSLDATLDKRTRELSFSFRVRSTDGRVVTGGSGRPFIVEVS
jgi:tRNA U54 and U55 pseudouridine synthase Pus10